MAAAAVVALPSAAFSVPRRQFGFFLSPLLSHCSASRQLAFCLRKAFSSSSIEHHRQSSSLLSNLIISDEVQNELRHGRAVVALESTLITHGLPHPINAKVAMRLEDIVREENAVPATIALLDGHIRVGLSQDQLRRIATPPKDGAVAAPVKVSRRDLANCLVDKRIGGTTVAATMWIAHKVGIRIFATGGIGGVHRGDNQDVSADLTELGRTPLGVVCAGVKSILDIKRTLEYLETQSVGVVVLDKTPNFPGFFGPPTSVRAPYHTESLEKVADILLLSARMDLPNGTLIACPLSAFEHRRMAKQRKAIGEATELALKEADEAQVCGKEVTPFVLDRVRQRVGTAATELNVALLENNARIGARLALICANKMCSNGKQQLVATAAVSVGKNCENGTLKKRSPKIVCAGASVVDVAVFVVDHQQQPQQKCSPPPAGAAYVPSRIVQTPGGVARNHADALSRLGCEVTLISALGTERRRDKRKSDGSGNGMTVAAEVDLFGRFLMDRCGHIDWSRVCHCADTPTASSVGICSKGTLISQGFISVDPIMEQMDNAYIRSMEAQIAEADFVLVDANLSSRSLRTIVELAQTNGTKIWFEPTNWTKVPKLFDALGTNALHRVSAISPNTDELGELARHLNDEAGQMFVNGFKAFLNSLSSSPSSSIPAAAFPSLINEWIGQHQVPPVLFPPSMSHLLITCDSMGVLLLAHPDDSPSSTLAHFVGPPNVVADHIVSVSGAGDCFNSGFLCAFLNGRSTVESVELANKCAALSLCSEAAVPETIRQWTN